HRYRISRRTPRILKRARRRDSPRLQPPGPYPRPPPALCRSFLRQPDRASFAPDQRRTRTSLRRALSVPKTFHAPRRYPSSRRQRHQSRTRPPPERTFRYQRPSPRVSQPPRRFGPGPLRLERALLRQRPRTPPSLFHQAHRPRPLPPLLIEVILLYIYKLRHNK